MIQGASLEEEPVGYCLAYAYRLRSTDDPLLLQDPLTVNDGAVLVMKTRGSELPAYRQHPSWQIVSCLAARDVDRQQWHCRRCCFHLPFADPYACGFGGGRCFKGSYRLLEDSEEQR